MLCENGSEPFQQFFCVNWYDVKLLSGGCWKDTAGGDSFAAGLWFCSWIGSRSAQLPAAPCSFPWNSQRQFCSQLFLGRHLPVNSFPRHLKGQISGKFQRADFKQIPPVWLLCHEVSCGCVPSNKVWISALGTPATPLIFRVYFLVANPLLL